MEPQTLTVWRQASKYSLPRIGYINKLDKARASVQACTRSMASKLGVRPLLVHLPLGEGRDFSGLVDLPSMRAFTWRREAGGRQLVEHSEEQLKTSMFHTWEAAVEARAHLVEELTEVDDLLAEQVIEHEDFEADTASVMAALRRVVLDPGSGALVTLLGSSKEGVGVQPLLDAIIDYCPGPEDRNYPELAKFGSNFCGLVFKVVHDPNKGPLCFVRVYSGELREKDSVYNVSQGGRGVALQRGQLLAAFADTYDCIETVSAGTDFVLGLTKVLSR